MMMYDCRFSDIKTYFENTFDIDESLFTSLAGIYDLIKTQA